jgi:hypothetical protein
VFRYIIQGVIPYTSQSVLAIHMMHLFHYTGGDSLRYTGRTYHIQVVLGYTIHGFNFLRYTGRTYNTHVILCFIIQGAIPYVIQGGLTVCRWYLVTLYMV